MVLDSMFRKYFSSHLVGGGCWPKVQLNC